MMALGLPADGRTDRSVVAIFGATAAGVLAGFEGYWLVLKCGVAAPPPTLAETVRAPLKAILTLRPSLRG
jgi:hypothetical protein